MKLESKFKYILYWLTLFVGCWLSIGATPTITSITPYYGSIAGSEEVTIQGSDLQYVTEVLFGDAAGTVLSTSKNKVIVRTPAHMPQAVHVVAIDFYGNSTPISEDDYFVYTGDLRGYSANSLIPRLSPFELETLAIYPPIVISSLSNALLTTSDGSKVFSINKDSNSVSVINPALNVVIATITVGTDPVSACITPDDKYLFVGNETSDTVSVIDIATNTLVSTISVGNTPSMVSVTPDGVWVLVTNSVDGTVSMIRVSSLAVGATVAVGTTPKAIAITPDSSKALIGNSGGSTVSVIDIGTQTVSGTISVGVSPNGIAISPPDATGALAGLAFVANYTDGTVSVINLATSAVVATIVVGAHPEDIVLNLDGSLAIVTCDNTNGPVAFIDVATFTNISNLVFDNPKSLVISPDGLQGLVSGAGESYIEKFQLYSPYASLEQSTFIYSSALLLMPDQAPLARFTYSLDKMNVVFDASESISPVGSIASYDWDFGDGSTESTTYPVVYHTYTTQGDYDVVLVVTNSAGTSTTKVYSYQSNPGSSGDTTSGSSLIRNGGGSATSTQTLQLHPPIVDGYTPVPDTNKPKLIISGSGFTNATKVLFGNLKARIVSITADEIVVVIPNLKGKKGVYITVKTPLGTSKKNKKSYYKNPQAKKKKKNHHTSSSSSSSSSCSSS